MQHETVQVIGLQVAQRSGKGLRHLFGKRCLRIVGNPGRILARKRREFGLQIQISASQRVAERCAHTGAHTSFVVMLGLTSGVDAAKTLVDREPDQSFGVRLLPSGSIDDPGYLHAGDRSDEVRHTSF